MKKYMEVGDFKVTALMTKFVLMVEPEMSALDAMRHMLERNFRCAFVARKKPYEELGIVTRFDIMRKVLAMGVDPFKVKVIDIMEKGMFYIEAEKTVREASRIMGENQLCHLPVKRKGRLIGVISSSDIFQAYVERS